VIAIVAVKRGGKTKRKKEATLDGKKNLVKKWGETDAALKIKTSFSGERLVPQPQKDEPSCDTRPWSGVIDRVVVDYADGQHTIGPNLGGAKIKMRLANIFA